MNAKLDLQLAFDSTAHSILVIVEPAVCAATTTATTATATASSTRIGAHPTPGDDAIDFGRLDGAVEDK